MYATIPNKTTPATAIPRICHHDKFAGKRESSDSADDVAAAEAAGLPRGSVRVGTAAGAAPLVIVGVMVVVICSCRRVSAAAGVTGPGGVSGYAISTDLRSVD
jgi:hypothetical protein